MITNEAINQAIDYIMQHISENITIEDVAEHCHFSKYYFSRMFKEETGESLYAFIKRIRIEQSAFRLKVDKDRSITDIGYEYGYTPSNYSSVFKQQKHESPAEFRKNIRQESLVHPFFHGEINQLMSFEECKRNITIEEFPDQRVLYERRKGNYHNLGEDWCTFIEKYQKYYGPDTVLIERTFDDPAITDIESCLYDICMTIPEDCTVENTTVITGGRFAVYHFTGRPYEIYAVYQSFFKTWFPQSHYQLDDRAMFEIYRSIDNEDGILTMEICFPIR